MFRIRRPTEALGRRMSCGQVEAEAENTRLTALVAHRGAGR